MYTTYSAYSYFIKELPTEFMCLDTVIETAGMLLNFQKPKNNCFSQVLQHVLCFDHSIQTQKSSWYSLIDLNSAMGSFHLKTVKNWPRTH